MQLFRAAAFLSRCRCATLNAIRRSRPPCVQRLWVCNGHRHGRIRVQSTKLKVADVELELFDSGQGARPVLFLHGGGGFSPRQPFVAPLSAKRRFIAPSHPGFGKSSLPDWLDSVDDIAHLYLELLDTLEARRHRRGRLLDRRLDRRRDRDQDRRSAFAGWCWSGRSASRSARPTSSTFPTSSRCRRRRCRKLLFHDPAKMKLDTAKMSDDELAAMFRNRETLALLVWEPWMHNPKLKRRLHRIATPTLFIRGESDGLVSADYLEAYAQPAAECAHADDHGRRSRAAAGAARRRFARRRPGISRRVT